MQNLRNSGIATYRATTQSLGANIFQRLPSVQVHAVVGEG